MSRTVVVVGGGLAGMVAALEARDEGAEVTLIDRGPIGLGSNSAMANGVFAGPSSSYAPEDYVRDTIQVGKGINNVPYVRLVAREAPAAFKFFRSLGLDLAETPGYYVLRSPRPDVIRGVTMVKRLAEKIRESEGIRILSGFQMLDIVSDNSRVYGVRGLSRAGEKLLIYGSAVVLATGGAGAIYLRNDNQKSTMGQGYFLAARAGLDLWDMEFVQFYPFVLAEPRLPAMMLYPPYPEEARLVDTYGENLAEKYGLHSLNAAIRLKRDELSALIFKEALEGPVRLDFTRVTAAAWAEYPMTLLAKLRFDFRRQPVTITPGAHFVMGGVRIDEHCRTSLPGLFACGEIVWGLHGANRRGGNALTECLVTGRIAGQHAAALARSHPVPYPEPEWAADDTASSVSGTAVGLKELRTSIRETAWKHAGVVRSEEGMKHGLHDLTELEDRLTEIRPGTVSEARLKEDLLSAVFVARAILSAGLARRESRGSFYREDFPRQDDTVWCRNSCLSYDSARKTFAVAYRQAVNESV